MQTQRIQVTCQNNYEILFNKFLLDVIRKKDNPKDKEVLLNIQLTSKFHIAIEFDNIGIMALARKSHSYYA